MGGGGGRRRKSNSSRCMLQCAQRANHEGERRQEEESLTEVMTRTEEGGEGDDEGTPAKPGSKGAAIFEQEAE